MRLRRWATPALAAAVGLSGCAGGSLPAAVNASPTPSPSPSPAALPASPPAVDADATAPITIGENTPAAQALLRAARRTAAAGSFQVALSAGAQGQGPGQQLVLSGTALSASPTRYRVSLEITIAGQDARSEAIGWDGRYWTRPAGGAWKAQSVPPGNPRGYLVNLRGASRVVDAGPDQHGGVTQERFTAHLDLSASGVTPVPGTTARSGDLTVWVGPGGYLDAEHILLYDAAGARAGELGIEISAIGQPQDVEPPA
jgi:hypothetical protein